VIEFTEFYFEKLGQTFLVWFVAWLVVVPLLLLAISPRQRPV
jgi:bacteriorhodopsin